MLTTNSMPNALRTLTRDGWLLFLTRFVRLFAYGSLSVVLVFYLIGLGLSESQTGLLLTLTLVGDTVISLYLTTRARPNRATAHAHRRRHSDGCCRSGFRLHAQFLASDSRRHDWCYKPKWQ